MRGIGGMRLPCSLRVDDDVDLTLAIERDALAAMSRHMPKTHLLEMRLQSGPTGIVGGEFDEGGAEHFDAIRMARHGQAKAGLASRRLVDEVG